MVSMNGKLQSLAERLARIEGRIEPYPPHVNTAEKDAT
jgi:hypothetical protein